MITFCNANKQQTEQNSSEQIQAQLRHAVRELEAIQHALDESVIVAVTDRQGKITYVNEAFCQISQYSREELIGQTHRIVNSGYHPRSFFKKMWQTIASGKVWKGVIRNRAKDGSYYWVNSTIVPVLDEQGKPYQYVSIRTDITPLKQEEEKVKYLAYHDELTGLANRRYVMENIKQVLDDARKNGQRLAVMFMDIARFKDINDTIGHHAGDEILKEVTRRLRRALPAARLLARMGGDEFLAIVAEQQCAGIETCLSALKTVFSDPVCLNERQYVLNLNTGISWFPDHGQCADSLLQTADLAMYQAKQQHQLHVVYDPAKSAHAKFQSALEQDLPQALAVGQLSVVMQPQYHLKTKRMLGVEALVRWHHPRYGQLGPGQFLPVAAELGLMGEIDLWVLRHSSLLFKQHQLADDQQLNLAINLSPATLKLANLPELMLKVLGEAQFEPKRLQVEITEEALVREMDQARNNIDRLKEMGISIALDDFGTGYSSLSQLHQLAPDCVKLDRALISGMEHCRQKQTIVEAVIALCRKLGIQTLAEGVENERQIQTLIDFGCLWGQSFYLSPPRSF
ncbi:GGDEF domain-containing protein [Caldalkalibacillus thermarum]|uniref:putative bifunctional diguanylate cyclase/phosphodiesterase n=1 Tax=Caldalkalibacillus thermarum TaxID=296745 RepID=UPI00166B8C35|nr:GGDEF domain-containing phosphodiesterase [Caldalkalibacillus thermarum]GGK30955.1 GGDEF domain-containing protein [Caldalkalibacillus thermarum]